MHQIGQESERTAPALKPEGKLTLRLVAVQPCETLQESRLEELQVLFCCIRLQHGQSCCRVLLLDWCGTRVYRADVALPSRAGVSAG